MLKKPDHIIRDQHGIKRVHCKICGTTIRDMVPSNRPTETSRINGKVVIRQHMVLGVTPVYKELTLVCKDEHGHQNYHVTHCCTQCAAKIDPSNPEDLKLLDKMYHCDLDELVIGDGMDLAMVNQWRKLHVVGVI